MVTGANGFPQGDRSGLGYHQALGLLRAGAEVIIASSDGSRGEEAVRRMRDEVPDGSVRFEQLDLASLRSVSDLASRMRSSADGLDLLINNAGVMGRIEREVSADGHERVFATNTLGHFALTAELLPMLQKGRASRVVWMASMRTSDALPFDDLQLERSYDYAAAYNHSKLANLLLAFELHRRSQVQGWKINSLAAHPGVARTNLIPDGPGLESREGQRFRNMPMMFQPAERGALPVLYAATSPDAAGGAYYGPKSFGGLRGLPGKAPIPPAADDIDASARLWAALESLSGVSFG